MTEDSDEPSMNGHSGRSNGARYASEGSVDANDQGPFPTIVQFRSGVRSFT